MFRTSLAVIVALAFAAACAGQSGAKGGVFIKRRPVSGANDPNAEIPGERPLYAVAGFDVVSIRAGSPQRGAIEHQAAFDGQLYLFASAQNRQAFAADPVERAPALSGSSIVGWANAKELRPGAPHHSTVHKNRLYLFVDDAEKKAFLADPSKFEDADLLLGGVSPTALVDREEVVRGVKDHEAVCEGWRVRFADAKEKAAFLADLGKYYPTFAGADPVTLFTSGRAQMGDPRNAFLYKNRLYLFATSENADRFRIDYKTFSDLDVAEGAYCPVTRVDENRLHFGKYGISTIHLGRRLLFATEDYRKKFLADPIRYLPDVKKKPPLP